VILNIPPDTKEVSIFLSGGTDSALLLYLICINKVDVVIHPLTAVEINSPFNKIAVINIMQEIRSVFPDIIIKDPIFKYFSQTNPTEDKANHFKYVMKPLAHRVSFDGTTHNPPMADMIELGMYNDRQEARDNNATTNILKFKPFINIDKKEIANLYIQYNLIDNLLPLTSSCVNPTHGTEPCKECWWCKEKHWAFGKYDFE